MKLVTKLLAVAAIAAGINNAFAEGGRKESVLDTGKGGVRLTISVPDFAHGPYDFAKNPGVGKSISDAWNAQQVMFNAKIGESNVVVYQARLDKVNPEKTQKRIDAEGLAQAEIESSGFTMDRAVKTDCPPAPFDGATIVCYKMSGDVVFEGKARPEKVSKFLAAISFANDTQGYSLMATVAERNAETFKRNSELIEKQARGAFKDMYRNHSISLN